MSDKNTFFLEINAEKQYFFIEKQSFFCNRLVDKT